MRPGKMREEHKKLAGIIVLILLVLFACAVMWLVGRPIVRFVSEPEHFRAWVDSHGVWAKLAFIGMTVFQVVLAVIPGEPFEMGAGYAFGTLEGTILSMIGTTIGSIIIFLLVRRFGVKLVEVFFPVEKIQSLRFLQNDRRRDILFCIIFAVPGTPKDLLSYFVGLTNMRLSTWVIIASVARFPSIITSTIGGDALGEEKYGFMIVVLAITLVLSICGILGYNAFTKRRNEKREKSPETEEMK